MLLPLPHKINEFSPSVHIVFLQTPLPQKEKKRQDSLLVKTSRCQELSRYSIGT